MAGSCGCLLMVVKLIHLGQAELFYLYTFSILWVNFCGFTQPGKSKLIICSYDFLLH